MLRLENPSATCYINAALQLLVHVDVKSWPESPAGQLLNVLKAGSSEVVPAWREINKIVGRDHKFVGYQGDAHEMFLEILRCVQDDDFVNQLFGLVYINTTHCLACGTLSHRDEISNQMTISNQVRTLGELFQGFFTPTRLHNEYKCDKCIQADSSVRTSAEIVTRVKTWPRYLFLHIMRFDGNRKVTDPFMFSLVFVGSRPQDPEYELDGLILHAGATRQSGHYVTITRESHGSFLLHNDEHEPKRILLSEIQNPTFQQQVYILMYRQRARKN